jgi:hypothetical protein
MRKRLTAPIPTPHDAPPLDEGWLELDRAAMVEVTSEENEHPVESALVLGEMRGWRAAASGTQIIRLFFDKPQRLASCWSSKKPRCSVPKNSFCDGLRIAGARFEKIVRPQWNFSPLRTTSENEEYHVAHLGCHRS